MNWTILCIADDPHALLLYRSVLELSGLRVLTTSSREYGLEICDFCSVNCVVLDGPQDGSILAGEIGRRHPHLPVVVVSDDTGIFLDIYREVEMFITKTEVVEELVECVEDVARRSKCEAIGGTDGIGPRPAKPHYRYHKPHRAFTSWILPR
jgi:DNA-binding NtrC family response regulator